MFDLNLHVPASMLALPGRVHVEHMDEEEPMSAHERRAQQMREYSRLWKAKRRVIPLSTGSNQRIGGRD